MEENSKDKIIMYILTGVIFAIFVAIFILLNKTVPAEKNDLYKALVILSIIQAVLSEIINIAFYIFKNNNE